MGGLELGVVSHRGRAPLGIRCFMARSFSASGCIIDDRYPRTPVLVYGKRGLYFFGGVSLVMCSGFAVEGAIFGVVTVVV